MAEGRPLRGDGADNLQDYVEERMTYGSDSDEYAEANRILQQQQAEIEALRQGGNVQPHPQSDPTLPAATEGVDSERMSGAAGASSIEATGDGQVNYDHLPPQAAARESIISDTKDQLGLGNLRS